MCLSENQVEEQIAKKKLLDFVIDGQKTTNHLGHESTVQAIFLKTPCFHLADISIPSGCSLQDYESHQQYAAMNKKLQSSFIKTSA